MIVVGAGMAGLLAAAMLRGDCAGVYEAQSSLPNNHSAVLRFRSSVVGDVLGIPFERVRVLKATDPWRNPVADALAYSRKTNGTATLRSVTSADGEISERYIAPPDLIGRMARALSCPLHLGEKAALPAGVPAISTMPMPALMDALGYEGERPGFQSAPGANVIVKLRNVDVFCTLYVPDPEFPGSRISITRDEMVMECYGPEQEFGHREVLAALARVGLNSGNYVSHTVKRQSYAKILPIDEGARRRFIMWASETHGVYSLGRYATWRPGLLLDDLVNDVRVVQRLANGGDLYRHKKKEN